MIPIKELREMLENRLVGHLPPDSLEALMRDIEGIDDEWEEVETFHKEMGYSLSVNCPDICWLADQIDQGAVIKFVRKKPAAH